MPEDEEDRMTSCYFQKLLSYLKDLNIKWPIPVAPLLVVF